MYKLELIAIGKVCYFTIESGRYARCFSDLIQTAETILSNATIKVI